MAIVARWKGIGAALLIACANVAMAEVFIDDNGSRYIAILLMSFAAGVFIHPLQRHWSGTHE